MTGKVKLISAGGGSVSLATPSTGSNRTVTLPDADLTIPATNSSGTLTTQGDILYRDGSGIQRLPKGTASQTLKMNSGATAPEWATVATPASTKVLQHVWNSNNTQNSSNTTSKAATGFGVCSITPTKATSIIRVDFVTCVHNSSNANVYFLLYFDTASSGYGVVPNIQSDNGFCRYTNYTGNESKSLKFTYDHDHNVTTEINYKIYWHTSDSGNTMRVNYDATYGTLSATEYDVTGDGQ